MLFEFKLSICNQATLTRSDHAPWAWSGMVRENINTGGLDQCNASTGLMYLARVVHKNAQNTCVHHNIAWSLGVNINMRIMFLQKSHH